MSHVSSQAKGRIRFTVAVGSMAACKAPPLPCGETEEVGRQDRPRFVELLLLGLCPSDERRDAGWAAGNRGQQPRLRRVGEMEERPQRGAHFM